MNINLYNKQDDFGQAYMRGIENVVLGLNPALEIKYLIQSMKDFNVMDQRLLDYSNTLTYCYQESVLETK